MSALVRRAKALHRRPATAGVLHVPRTIVPPGPMERSPRRSAADLPGAASPLARLRRRVRSLLFTGRPAAAAELAQALVCMSGQQEDDMCLLARAYAADGQRRRAADLLQAAGLLRRGSLAAASIAAAALVDCAAWEEASNLLERVLPAHRRSAVLAAEQAAWADGAGGVEECDSAAALDGGGAQLVAALALLRGRVFQAADNARSAAEWYCFALRCDAFCVEAFNRLKALHLLTAVEEEALLEELTFGEDERWLQLLYSARVSAAVGSGDVAAQFEQLQGELQMGDNPAVLAAKASCLYARNDSRGARALCERALAIDAHAACVLPVYVAALSDLQQRGALFSLAHRLVQAAPQAATSWFAVGAYYSLIGRHSAARNFFRKATTLDRAFAPAWIGFAHAFAALDESDQALAAYRSCARLFPGSHVVVASMGTEYLRTNHAKLAEQHFRMAIDMCPRDPLAHSELGVALYRQRRWKDAEQALRKALALTDALPPRLQRKWEPTRFNLGHALRQQLRLDDALACYRKALALSPQSASAHAAIGWTLHLKSDLDGAVLAYHSALALQHDNRVAEELLGKALAEIALTAESPTDVGSILESGREEDEESKADDSF
eukprot:PLAT8458.1.p1 GENE.PLAT8458.1~~PLAT8458.1.p1  ORF type:complete len:628 (-),score=339.16 PLAT8458.1:33-1868(-)